MFDPCTCLGRGGCKPTASCHICFNPHTCFGPGCKPTASYQLFFNPRTCLSPVGCKPTASCHICSIPTLVLVLLVANLQPHIAFVQSSHLFRPCWLQTYSLMSLFVQSPHMFLALPIANLQPHIIFFNPHTFFGPVGCKPTVLYLLFSIPTHVFGPAGCKPTASYRVCSILALVLALLVANLQPHIVFVQSSHLFWPCWLQTYSLISFLFNPHTCFGPVGCKPTASYHFFQSPHLFSPCRLQTYSLISIAFNQRMCFWPCWLQTYSLISIVFNRLTCFGPAGCKPTASYRFCSILALV